MTIFRTLAVLRWQPVLPEHRRRQHRHMTPLMPGPTRLYGQEDADAQRRIPATRPSTRASTQAHGFIYVLEGWIVMSVQSGESTMLTPGQTFYAGRTMCTSWGVRQPHQAHLAGSTLGQFQLS
jgi:hypothetical protein